MITVIQTTQSFHALGMRARMALLNDIKRFTDDKAKESLRLALLWVNTALDAYRVGEVRSARDHLNDARMHIKIAVITEQYAKEWPLKIAA